jgi:hypothetical protein
VTNIQAVALDLDGTLAGNDHRVSAHALAVLRELDRIGIFPIIVTGRSEYAATGIARAAGITAPVISCNGAVVSTPHRKRLRLSQFDQSTVVTVREFSHAHQVEAILWTPSSIHAEVESDNTALLAAINGETVSISNPVDEPVVKMMLAGSSSELDGLAAEVAHDVPFMQRSMTTFYESSPPGADKWDSLRFVLEKLGVAPEACIGFGDGDTDRNWMSQVGEAIAVQNARSSVLEIASTTIGHHADDSVATYLAERFSVQL